MAPTPQRQPLAPWGDDHHDQDDDREADATDSSDGDDAGRQRWHQ
jgi:hypothetical protein